MASNNYITNSFHTVILFQVLLSNTNNFKTDLLVDGILIVDLRVISMKRYTTISRSSEQEPHYLL